MTIVVAAAVIEQDGRLLVTRRPTGVHLEGLWEFPGGKCHEGESLRECLRRELVEELGTDAVVGEEIFSTSHEYEGRTVTLHFFECSLMQEPRPLLGQQMRWVARSELGSLPFPPADAELIELLRDRRTRSGQFSG
jgi:8-oxo-dGTP diphosphatase